MNGRHPFALQIERQFRDTGIDSPGRSSQVGPRRYDDRPRLGRQDESRRFRIFFQRGIVAQRPGSQQQTDRRVRTILSFLVAAVRAEALHFLFQINW
jgi:hypothetical protein